MKKSINWMIVIMAAVIFSACGQVSFKKTKGGMPYKVFASDKGTPVDTGTYLRLQLTQKVNDSVLLDTYGKLPIYIKTTSESHPYDISEIWLSLKEGDSVLSVQALDTFIKRNPMGVPPQFKAGDRLYTTFKIEKVLKNDSAYQEDLKKAKDELSSLESAQIADYLSKNKITATKTKSGAFVEILQPGTGPKVDSGKVAMSWYKGTTFENIVFDTNMDSAFGHPGVTPFVIGMAGKPGGLTLGFDECMQTLQQGSKARFYIPSMLAYGPQQISEEVKAFSNLKFEVEVVEVKDNEAQPAPPMPQRPKLDISKALENQKKESSK